MQIRKTFKNLQPELLCCELKDFPLWQGITSGEDKLDTFSTPIDSSPTIFQGSLSLKTSTQPQKECVRNHMQGTTEADTVAGDIDEVVLNPKQEGEVHPDIVVMSTHGHSGFGRFDHGSIAYKVLDAGNTPLMLVKLRQS
jgi:hypothetical protein